MDIYIQGGFQHLWLTKRCKYHLDNLLFLNNLFKFCQVFSTNLLFSWCGMFVDGGNAHAY